MSSTSTIEMTDIELFIDPTHEPEETCELVRYPDNRCTRAAYVVAHLSKPCGHFNMFLLCEPCWNDVLAGNIMGLRCGRCKESFDIKSCIIGWDLL